MPGTDIYPLLYNMLYIALKFVPFSSLSTLMEYLNPTATLYVIHISIAMPIVSAFFANPIVS